jgi:hypothetical protein
LKEVKGSLPQWQIGQKTLLIKSLKTMDGNLNDIVVCCFCGESLLLKEAAILIVQPNILNEEKQQLFCHRNHLIEKLDKTIILHPDFFVEENKNN